MALTREALDQNRIDVLRELGKKMGLPNATTLSKSKLIDAILFVQDYGLDKYSTGKDRPGRPKKQDILSTDMVAEAMPIIRLNNPQAIEEYAPKEENLRDLRTQNNNAVTEVEMKTAKPEFRTENRDAVRELQEAPPEETEEREGVLEILPDGYGFLRAHNFEQGVGDAYISAVKIRRCGLRKGDWVKAQCRKEADSRPAAVLNILKVNGAEPGTVFRRPTFDSLTPIYPDKRYKLEAANTKNEYAIRAIDLVAPIGKGQRAMIVSPPKAGKTTLLKKIAASISKNYPTAYLMVLLIDERPEEVTDMQRSINGEVVYSTFDEMPEHHTKAAELVLERAKRIVELGGDVVILMDSLTRLARAYNLVIAPTGRTLSGGIDPGALHNPKRFFGAARNIENGGSLTIVATALIDTGSRMDDVIYEEFKGTGNMEIHLDRKLSEKRIFPAIDLNRSGTRKEELLLDDKELEGVWAVRKMLSAGDNQEAAENLFQMIVKSDTNKEFIDKICSQVSNLQKAGYNIK